MHCIGAARGWAICLGACSGGNVWVGSLPSHVVAAWAKRQRERVVLGGIFNSMLALWVSRNCCFCVSLLSQSLPTLLSVEQGGACFRTPGFFRTLLLLFLKTIQTRSLEMPGYHLIQKFRNLPMAAYRTGLCQSASHQPGCPWTHDSVSLLACELDFVVNVSLLFLAKLPFCLSFQGQYKGK